MLVCFYSAWHSMVNLREVCVPPRPGATGIVVIISMMLWKLGFFPSTPPYPSNVYLRFWTPYKYIYSVRYFVLLYIQYGFGSRISSATPVFGLPFRRLWVSAYPLRCNSTNRNTKSLVVSHTHCTSILYYGVKNAQYICLGLLRWWLHQVRLRLVQCAQCFYL